MRQAALARGNGYAWAPKHGTQTVMNVVLVYLRLYGSCAASAAAALVKNLWTLLLPMALFVAFFFLGSLLGGRGNFAGGIALGLARAAAFSVYTYFLAGVVGRDRVALGDLKKSVGAYFWTWINLFFVLWIVDLLLGFALAVHPRRDTILLVVSFMELVVLNVTPEVIYLKRSWGGLETIQRSFQFLQENWIEWFIPNGLIIAGLYLFVSKGGLALLGPLGALVAVVASGALFHAVMVFRGFLFEALDGSTHRQRMFRYRRTGS
ncbi:MAG: hypothetical protein AB1938_16600 [Myxococcota bacterium]